ncbi:MAG TPA: hypothetical protein VJB90_04860 [Candidatus Nanoarchaeia archaeon]|nr:hypothetical protein [Candidatus Nanoarchaeia archaeon]
MDSEAFARVCLGMALLSIFFLYVVVALYSPKEVEIEEIYEKGIDEKVRLKGTIVNVINANNTAIISLGHYATADVVVFVDGRISLSKGQEIRVDGRIAEFRGKKELVADEISLISDVP